MRKLFLILTIVCLLATVTIINAIPVSAGDLTITPTAGGPEDPGGPHHQPNPGPGPDPTPELSTTVEIPVQAGEDLSGVAELNPILEYVGDQIGPPGKENPHIPQPPSPGL